MPTCVVVGNPKPASRTLAAATLLMDQLTGRPPDAVIDVITLGAGLLGWGDPGVAEAVATVKQADVLVVASPTYKATYTGVLKLFLDQFGAGSLDGALTFPLMLGAGLQHALAPELLLKPVLVEIGGTCPMQGLFLLDTDTTLTGAQQWLQTARRQLPGQYAANSGSGPGAAGHAHSGPTTAPRVVVVGGSAAGAEPVSITLSARRAKIVTRGVPLFALVKRWRSALAWPALAGHRPNESISESTDTPPPPTTR